MWVFLVCVLIVLLDQFTKYIIYTNFYPHASVPVIKHILHISYVQNRGAAFGVFVNQTTFFIIVSVITILFMAVFLKKSKPIIMRLSLVLILSGAIGNLIDRLRFGYVVDFIDFRIWPVFNVADSSITVGALLLAWQILMQKDNRLKLNK